MKNPIRTTLVAVAAAAAGLVAVPAFSQSASGGTPPATQATPQPGAGMHGGHGMQGGHGMHGGHHGKHGAHRGEDRGERMMMRADANGDGKLARDELQAAQKSMADRAMQAFDAADADRDGTLSVDERRAFRDAMRAQMGGQPAAHRHGGAPRAPGAPAPGRPGAPVVPGA